MDPDRHLVISGVAGAAAAIAAGLPPGTVVAWTVIAGAAGVLVDIDHVLLPMLVTGAWRRGGRWFLRPVTAFTRPGQVSDDLSYRTMVFHRLASHTAVFLGIAAAARLVPVLAAAVVGVGAHIVADVAWDLSRGTYRERSRWG